MIADTFSRLERAEASQEEQALQRAFQSFCLRWSETDLDAQVMASELAHLIALNVGYHVAHRINQHLEGNSHGTQEQQKG